MATSDMHTTYIDTVLRGLVEGVSRTQFGRWTIDSDDSTLIVAYQAADGAPASIVTGAVVLDERPDSDVFDAMINGLPFGRLRTLEDGRVVVEEALPAEGLTSDLIEHTLSFVTWAARVAPSWATTGDGGSAASSLASTAQEAVAQVPEDAPGSGTVPDGVVNAAGYL